MATIDEQLKADLREWGATDVSSSLIGSRGSKVLVDFDPPFPGDHPIGSGIVLVGNDVTEATVRYGVLDESKFREHPSNLPDQFTRLKTVATRSNVFDVGKVFVDFGDADHAPRPHLAIGTRLRGYGDGTIVDNDDARNYPLPETLGIIKRFGRNVRQEFANEYVEGET